MWKRPINGEYQAQVFCVATEIKLEIFAPEIATFFSVGAAQADALLQLTAGEQTGFMANNVINQEIINSTKYLLLL